MPAIPRLELQLDSIEVMEAITVELMFLEELSLHTAATTTGFIALSLPNLGS